MKTIGLIGGLSWQSSMLYYRFINEFLEMSQKELTSAKLILNSVNFRPYATWQHEGNWAAIGEALQSEAKRLVQAGAEGVAVASNTMHKVAAQIKSELEQPFLSISAAISKHLESRKVQSITLLGTRFTMSEPFLVSAIEASFKGQIQVPTPPQQEVIHNIIFSELCQGQVKASSQAQFKAILSALPATDAYLLACTELGLLAQGMEEEFLFLDSAKLHAEALAEWSVGGDVFNLEN